MESNVDSAAGTTMGDGLRPSLAELVALRRNAHRLAPARRGRLGHAGSAPAPMRGRGMEYAESRE
jgi:hypothetical protein